MTQLRDARNAPDTRHIHDTLLAMMRDAAPRGLCFHTIDKVKPRMVRIYGYIEVIRKEHVIITEPCDDPAHHHPIPEAQFRLVEDT